jgi:protein MpaA
MKRQHTHILTACALYIVLALSGCYKPVDYPVIVKVLPPPIPEPETPHPIVGNSIENRPMVHTVLGQGSDVTFVLAAIHGNEQAGIPLIRRLEKYLQQYQKILEKRKVVLLPIANPDGVANNSRYNARGIDLNRNFPAHNRINSNRFGLTALSEPETRFIFQLIRKHSPDRIVTIHQPLACIDYDGPSRALANRMAEYCNLPLKKIGAKPGSLGSHAGVMLGIPVITLELPRSADRFNSERLWQQYGPSLVAAVAYPHRAK